MQSVFLHDKKRQMSQKALAEIKKLNKIKAKRIKSRIALAQQFMKRVSNLVIKLPNNLSPKPLNTRSESSKNFRTNYTTEKERIKAACASNQWLDTTPTINRPPIYRNRDRSKEISSDFKFRPTTSVERVQDTREKQASILQTSTPQSNPFPVGRTYLSYYHPASYTKTFESMHILNQIPILSKNKIYM